MNRLTFSGAILRRVLFAENRQNLAIFLPSAFVQCPQCNLQRKQSLAYGGYSNPDKLQTPFFVSLRSPFRKQKVQTRLTADAINRWYEQCANGVDFKQFMQTYSMEDTFFQWFHVTVLHLWMLSCRLTLEPDEKYLMYRQHLLKLLWNDVEQRMPLYFEKSEVYRFKRKINIHLYECLMTAYAELDEGLLSDDKALAGALWRNAYEKRTEENFADLTAKLPALNRLTRYVRQQLNYLTNLKIETLFISGVDWNAISTKK